MKMKIAIYILLCGMCFTATAAQISVHAQLDDKPIYAGQRFDLNVVIDGDNIPGVVNEEPLKAFSPMGPQVRDLSQSTIMNVNGKTTKRVVKRYLINYKLLASTAGEYIIPSLDVVIEGKTYKTSLINIEVLEPGTTNRIAIEAELSRKECYVGQPIILTVKWYVWQTIAGRVSDYMFNVPAFIDSDFIIDDIGTMQVGRNQNKLQVNGVDVIVNQKGVKYEGDDCVEVSFKKVLIPQKVGKLDLGEISILCKINTSQSRFTFKSEYKSFGSKADAIELNVLKLPQEGKPDEFYGLIGKYDIKTEAQPVDVKVGDPITLKISIGGRSYLKPVQWPDLSLIKGLSDDFILPIEQSSPEIINGRKVFTQTIRAKNDKINNIPSLPLSYFDIDKGEYVTKMSKPIELNVDATKVLTLSDVESGNAVESGRKLHAVKGGMSANYVGSELLVDMAFVPQKELLRLPAVLIWAGAAVLFVVSAVVKSSTYNKDVKAVKKRKRVAAQRAIAALKQLKDTHPDAKAVMASTIKTYFADRFDRTAGSLTDQDCRQIVESQLSDHRDAENIASILEKCEASEYSPLSVEFDKAWVEDAIKIIERVEKCVR